MTVTPQNPNDTAINVLKQRVDALKDTIRGRSIMNSTEQARLDESTAQVNAWQQEVADLERTIAEFEAAGR